MKKKNRTTNSEVIIPAAGYRNNGTGSLNNQGGNGNYWSSTVNGTNAYNLNFNSTAVNPANNNNRANGFSVRCIQHSHKPRECGGDATLLLDLFRAYFDARKHKRSTVNALAFEEHYEENLFALYGDIVQRRYKIARSICFIVKKPVKREIFAADFRDRVVHHLLFNYLNPIFEPHFIADSYSCRKGKGTSAGIRRLEHFIRSCSENHSKKCWVLKLDIRGYFMAMDKDILYKKIECGVREARRTGFDPELALYLAHKVIFNDPTKNFVSKSARENWIGLPKSKSLFFAPERKGLPVGNLTSQFFSNVYLDEFDHFVREELGIERYGRYVDDMVFVHSDKEFLKALVPKLDAYLHEHLALTIHPKKVHLQEAAHGVNFLGAFVKPWRTYAGRRIKRNFYARLEEWNALSQERGGLGEDDVPRFLSSVNSYLGFLRHYDTFKLRCQAVSRVCRRILDDVMFSRDLVMACGKAAAAILLCLSAAFAVPVTASASAPYLSSGTVVSANLLAGESAASITDFYYNLTSLPGNSSVTVQFSKDGTNWYSASGSLGVSTTLSSMDGATLSLSALGWSGSTFYYRITLNATSDLSATPVLSGVRLDYVRAPGYESMLSVDSTSGNVEVGGGGGAGGSALSVVGGAAIGPDYFSHTSTNGLLVEGWTGIGTYAPSSQLTLDDSGNGKFFEALNSTIASGKGGLVLSHYSDSSGGTDVAIGNNYYLNGSGSVKRQDVTNSGWDVELNNRSGFNDFALNYINSSGGASNFLTVTSAGKFGVSTSSPTALLTVQGPDTASTTAFNVINSAGTTVFAVYDNGNSTYSGSIFQSSDERLKTDVQSLAASSSLSLIEQLNPVSYLRIDQPGTGENLGFLAQQVGGVFPELVSTTSPTALTPDGTLTLNYEGLIAPVVSAIQEIASVSDGFETNLIAWLGNAGNGIGDLFANNLHAQTELCIGSTCIDQEQLAAVLAASGQGSSGTGGAGAATDSSDDSSSTPPVIEINGDNPATVPVGITYQDLGAAITGPAQDLNLGIEASIDGGATTTQDQITVDTTQAGTHTILYCATDQSDLTACAIRTVNVVVSDNSGQDATSTDATSTSD